MTDSSTVAPSRPPLVITPLPRPGLSHSPLEAARILRQLREEVGSELTGFRFKVQLAQYVRREYSSFPTREAERYATDAVRTVFPTGPPPVSSYWQFPISLPPGRFTGYDHEHCQRLCAAVEKIDRDERCHNRAETDPN